MIVGFMTTYAISAYIITNVVSSNPTQEIQHYVSTFVSALRQVGGFLRIPRFPPPIKELNSAHVLNLDLEKAKLKCIFVCI
jgi:hypothetical protein